MNQLRICLVSQEFPPHTNWGGVGVQFENLASVASAMGHHVVVVSRASLGAPAYERREPGVEVWRIGVPNSRRLLTGRTLDRILHARAVLAKVSALDAAEPFDVIEAAEANFDAEHLITRAGYLDRVVICCHGGNLQGQATGGLLAPLHRLDFAWSCRREHEMLRRARTIVVSSETTRHVVLGHGVDPFVVQKVALGIDTERFGPASPTTAKEGPVQVGFVGRLQERKGLDYVWRVMDRLGSKAGVRFRFKGAVHPASKNETIRLLRDHSAFAEYQEPGTPEEMPAFYRSLDVLLLPSRFENFGLTYAEAMATELVVIAGKGGGGTELIADGVNGFLVDPDGPVDLVVERLLAIVANRDAFAHIGKAARQEIVDHYSIRRFGEQKLALYRALQTRTARKSFPEAAATHP